MARRATIPDAPRFQAASFKADSKLARVPRAQRGAAIAVGQDVYLENGQELPYVARRSRGSLSTRSRRRGTLTRAGTIVWATCMRAQMSGARRDTLSTGAPS